MKEKKVIKRKVTKRKLKVKNVIILLIILILLGVFSYYLTTLKIKNIYVLNTNILDDKTVIYTAKLEDYPSFILTKSSEIKKNLLKNDYIKDVKVTKSHKLKVYLEIEEYKPIAITTDNKLILESGKIVNNDYELKELPILINDVSSILENFCKYFSKIDNTILSKISQVEYTPNNVDNQRFLLYTNDGNYVYVTLTKIEKVNKYNSIKDQIGEDKGIIYLDSGDYIEIKEEHKQTPEENKEESS